MKAIVTNAEADLLLWAWRGQHMLVEAFVEQSPLLYGQEEVERVLIQPLRSCNLRLTSSQQTPLLKPLLSNSGMVWGPSFISVSPFPPPVYIGAVYICVCVRVCTEARRQHRLIPQVATS